MTKILRITIIILLFSFPIRCKIIDKKQPRFIFITTCVEEDFFKPVKKGMQDAASLMGVECSFVGTQDVDIIAQKKMVKDAINSGVEGIALNIIDTIAFDDVIEEAVNKGIPVVSFNSDDNLKTNLRFSTVSQDHFKAGQLFGKRVINHIQENTTVLITMHSKGISALEERFRGIHDILQEKNITFKVIITTNIAETASLLIADSLRRYKDINTVLCTGLGDTEGTGIAIERYLIDRKIFAAGFDLSPLVARFIKKGQLFFTVDQQPYMQGFYPVIQLSHYYWYGIMPCDNVIEATFVSSVNIDRVEKLIYEGYR